MVRFLAYVDPGTGSFVLQAAAGALMGIGYMVRGRIRWIIGKLRRSEKPGQAVKPEPR